MMLKYRYKSIDLCKISVVGLLTLFFTIHIAAFQTNAQGKLSPKLTNSYAEYKDKEIVISVSFTDSINFKNKYLNRVTIIRRYPDAGIVWVKIKYDQIIEDLLNDPNIVFIDKPRLATVESSTDYANPAFNRITKAHHFFPALNGNSLKISVKEKGFNGDDIDLINRSFTTSVTPKETSQHATAMASLIAGAGNSSTKGRGVAFAAGITSSDFENLLPDPDIVFSDHNIHLQNHSYGVGIENYYGNEAAAYDQQVFQNPTLLHVFSAGNLGGSAPETGTYKGLLYANLSGTFKQAKNVLLVSAVDTTFYANPLNSKGPAFDGRLKPELTAFGQGGTSDAAALVTGISALGQEKYQQIHGELPLSSTVKAVLIASADDLGQEGIDYTYGYGSVNASRALQLLTENHTAVLSLGSNETDAVSIDIPDNTTSIKIATVWTDPPASPNSATALVHNIDSYLFNGSASYLPWVLNTKPNTDSLIAPAKRGVDTINNVEYITVTNPPTGRYHLVVKTPALTTESQVISVAYWLEKDTDFHWDYPTGSDIMEAGARLPFFWHHHDDDHGKLYYQLNNGEWRMVDNDIDLNQYFFWTAPDTIARARFRMDLAGKEYLSDEFTISPLLKMNVAFNCADEFALTWNSIQGAENYEVYAMGNTFLEPVLTTSDTSVVIDKGSATGYYSVAPITGVSTGLKSQTIDYNLQGTFCYFNLFTAERYDQDQVIIRLKLSSSIGIDHITILKMVEEQQDIWTDFNPDNTTSFELLDDQLQPGYNKYQARLFFTDGSSLYSDTSEVLIETKGRAILYPNPVTTSSYLNILSEGLGLKIRIIDENGKLLHEKDLESTDDYIDVVNLSQGLYFYQLIEDGKVIDTGKFAKL